MFEAYISPVLNVQHIENILQSKINTIEHEKMLIACFKAVEKLHKDYNVIAVHYSPKFGVNLHLLLTL